MQLLVVGATGGTGREVVRQGLDAGHDITAFVRSPAKLPQHPRLRDAPFFGRLFMRTLLRNIYADKAIGEDLVRRSDLAWTIVQPVQMTDGPLTRRYQIAADLKPRGMPKISRADVADFLLALLDDAKYVRKTVRIAY